MVTLIPVLRSTAPSCVLKGPKQFEKQQNTSGSVLVWKWRYCFQGWRLMEKMENPVSGSSSAGSRMASELPGQWDPKVLCLSGGGRQGWGLPGPLFTLGRSGLITSPAYSTQRAQDSIPEFVSYPLLFIFNLRVKRRVYFILNQDRT